MYISVLHDSPVGRKQSLFPGGIKEIVMDGHSFILQYLDLMHGDLGIIPVVVGLFIICLALDLVSKQKGGK